MGIPLYMFVSSQITVFLIFSFKPMWRQVFNKLPLLFINFIAVYCACDVHRTDIKSTDFFKLQQFIYSSTICMLHYDPQHVSSSTLLILRRTNCITTASGIVTLCKQPYSMQVESSEPTYCTAVYRGWRYQRLWWYNWSSWGWAACCSKHVEDYNVTYILL